MQVDWELSQQFVSDSQGIRAVCVLPTNNNNNDDEDKIDNTTLVTGNQGGGLCAFGIPSGSLHPIEYQHNHAVTALVSDDESSHYITGCKDATIRVFDSTTNTVVATLTGHEKPVTSLSFVSTNEGRKYLLSGSWDGTAKVWDVDRKAMIATLPDHENSVCVTGLQSETSDSNSIIRIATGSAGAAQNNQISGHSVRIWTVDVKTGQVTCKNTVSNDHQGPIRDIALLPGGHVVTCSNDGTVKLRTQDKGDCISTLVFLQQSHPPMLLSVTSVGEDGSSVAAGAEDGNVVVWNLDGGEGGEPQIILHPACVWNVTGLPNGDLVTCCQDGTLRVFTRATDRMAPISEREEFSNQVQQAHAKKSSGPSAEEVAKLPLWEQNLQKRGTSEGQVQLFNKGGVAIAAQWSATSQTWIEVGQVMGSSDGGSIDGVQYDHVLPIEVDQTGGGVAKLQLGYNNGENPFVAAQRFIDSYQLPQHHLSDIADYIQQRVGNEAPTLGMGGGGGGGGTPAPVATTGIPMASYEHVPMPGYKSFELGAKSATTTLEKMKTKITEVGKLSDTQLANLSTLIDTLGATNRYHATKVDTNELSVITAMIDTFPPAEVFPALDLARLTVVHPDAASSQNSKFWSTVISKAVALCGDEDPVTSVAVPMLSLRLFANAFRGGPGSREAVSSLLDTVLPCAVKFIPSKNKNVRLSVATVLYNISYYFQSQPPARPDIAQELVGGINTILKNHGRTYEGEAITRTLIALGTAALASKDAKDAAKSIHVVSLVEMCASPHGDIAKAVAKEVYNVLA